MRSRRVAVCTIFVLLGLPVSVAAEQFRSIATDRVEVGADFQAALQAFRNAVGTEAKVAGWGDMATSSIVLDGVEIATLNDTALIELGSDSFTSGSEIVDALGFERAELIPRTFWMPATPIKIEGMDPIFGGIHRSFAAQVMEVAPTLTIDDAWSRMDSAQIRRRLEAEYTYDRLTYSSFGSWDLEITEPPFAQQIAPGIETDNPSLQDSRPSRVSTGASLLVQDPDLSTSCLTPICANPVANPDQTVCVGDNCRQPSRMSLLRNQTSMYANVTVVRGAFTAVVPILSFVRGGGAERRVSCTATAITPTMLLTALHCIAPDAETFERRFERSPGSVDGWSILTTRYPSTDQFVALPSRDDQAHRISQIHVPYNMTETPTFTSTRVNGDIPNRDLAILQLEEGSRLEIEATRYPVLARAPIQQDHAISFAGYGWSNAQHGLSDYLSLRDNDPLERLLLIAFNFATHERGRPDMITWRQDFQLRHGGPCRNDSGGPVYAGFNRGFENSPNILVGVVSAIHRIEDSDGGISLSRFWEACSDPLVYGAAQSIQPYRENICQITARQARGC